MPPIFDHILVPVDFTGKNQAALDLARELSARGSARLTLLHVIEAIEPGGDRDTEDFNAMLETQARSKLQALATLLEKQGFAPIQEIVFGKRTAEIVGYAAEENVTLVIMSSHKVELASPQHNLGTVSHQVSILCPCPVLLVK